MMIVLIYSIMKMQATLLRVSALPVIVGISVCKVNK